MLLSEGQICPEFSGIATNNTEISRQSLSGKTTILFFYPKDFTPGCTTEACSIRDAYSTIAANAVQVFGISKDPIAKHIKFKEKYNLPYELISDAETNICEQFGVWQEKSMFGKKYMGIIRSTFMINPDLTIAKIWPKVAVGKHADEIINAIT